METQETSRPFWRQGDIYFVKLDGARDLAQAKAVKDGIIARGETTGHAHRLSPASITAGALLCLLNEAMMLRAPEAGAVIVHDEHGPVDLPEGIYAVVHQREFDGLTWRQVWD
jgi:hypothetical protein